VPDLQHGATLLRFNRLYFTISYMDILIIILQFFLSLSILVVLHEGGHFAAARWFNTRVEKFYLFFDPWFSIAKKKIGDTEYGIGWLPLGGYVKISGMVDESMDLEQMKQPAEPWEFRSKPAWQRLIIMLGGVTVNFILGFLIFGLILVVWGDSYIPSSVVKEGIYVDSIGRSIGLQDGDKILALGGAPFEKFDSRKLIRSIVIDGISSIKVQRNGSEVDIPIDKKWVTELSSHKNKGVLIFGPRMPLEVQKLVKGSPAELAGIQPGDRIISINDEPVKYLHEFSQKIHPEPQKSYVVTVLRNGNPKRLEITTDSKGKFGMYWKMLDVKKEKYSIWKALPMGVTRGIKFLKDQLVGFKKMFSGEIKASESLGGFATIAQLFPTTWDWEQFWKITAVLSLILGFMNLLPIPALDGGHVMFLLYEMVSGKKPSDKVMEVTTMIGMILLFGLLLYANGMDIIRYFK